MQRRHPMIPLLRFGAVIVLAIAVVAVGVKLAAGGWEISTADVADAVLMLALAAAVALAMFAVSALLGTGPDVMAAENNRALVRVQTQLNELTAKLIQLDDASERIARAQENAVTQPPPLTITPADLEPLHQALQELRDISMLPDEIRRERLAMYRAEKKASQVKRAFDLVASRQWHDAERLVMALETEYPNDGDVSKARSYLNHARTLHEEETISHTIREAEELMAGSSWDQALARARSLADGFPHSGEARALLHRVQREREIYYESSVARMFDELVHDIDRRMWRRALVHAQSLLQKFPTHPRAEGVRRQLKTLQDNAEIEERQELEVRIQELIRAQRFEDAIHLSEDLIRRYPLSPQAESLDVLLPRLRELVEQGAGARTGAEILDAAGHEQQQPTGSPQQAT